ncbi:MAG: FAD-dependent oxidoreductase [bacterium]|nr:FAD-dependent oxidoreductase [bacterium]
MSIPYNEYIAKKFTVVIVGGGVVGCAIAYELSRHKINDVLLLERNDTIPGINQSSRNGGVIHSGIYYPKSVEPLKAALCIQGNDLMYDFCRHFNVPCKQTGKLILATNPQEDEYLHFFYGIGQENNVSGLRMLTGAEAKHMEPNLSEHVTLAIYVPSCGSVALDPFVTKLHTIADQYGVIFQTASNVTGITIQANGFALTVDQAGQQETVECETLINAAGLYADEIAKMVNEESPYEIEGTRGDLAEFDCNLRPDVNTSGMHLYPAPFCYDNETKETVDEKPEKLLELLKAGKVTKTLGTHVSPVFVKDGDAWSITKVTGVGPLKTMETGKEDYETNFHPMSDFANKVRPYFPNLKETDLRPRFSGIMAVLKGKTDFVIERDKKYPQCINLVGMDSPAWTAALAIAEYVHTLYRR